MSTASPQHSAKVLIVDDSRMVRASIIKHIRDRFEFREEADGEAGWQALVVDPTIDMVLTDIGMPQLDGYGLLERIRSSRLSRLQHMPVIVISGDEDESAREHARKLGADDFITKGISTSELLARLDSMSRLSATRKELEESRAALAQQQSVDSAISTTVTETAVNNWATTTGLSLPQAEEGGVTAMVIDIDRFDELVARYGLKVAELVARKLSRILTAKVRQEDTVAQLGPGRFVVLSPLADSLTCSAFALRLQKAIRKLVMTYREDRIRIAITVGVASSAVDGAHPVSRLIGIAVERVATGTSLGGSRVVCELGEVTDEVVDRALRQNVSIDQALLRLKMGDDKEVLERLPQILARLLPLLKIMESEMHCGIPVSTLAGLAAQEENRER